MAAPYQSDDWLILRKIIKTVATRCQILRLKCAKLDFGRGLSQTPLGEHSPGLPSWNKERGGCRKGGGKERGRGSKKEEEGREEKGGDRGILVIPTLVYFRRRCAQTPDENPLRACVHESVFAVS